jgi:hypothetical protein
MRCHKVKRRVGEPYDENAVPKAMGITKLEKTA